MRLNSFYEVQGILARWPHSTVVDTPIVDSGPDRLRRALRGLANGKTGSGDLAGLIRQVLARQAMLEGHMSEPPEFLVPQADGWPSRNEWGTFGMEIRAESRSYFVVRALPWRPSWLEFGDRIPLEDVHRETRRRRDASVPADPAFSELLDPQGQRYQTYSSPGQREAVRAAFLMQPGAILLVNLPTGAGKSHVFQAPAFAARLDGALTVIIVPTVALARDLERRFLSVLGEQEGPLAYHGGLEPDLKRAMRGKIRGGEQTIVITSPESALGALRPALFDAARAGRLRYFVIDEAHLIAQWGTEFRPEFQLLVGLRAGLLNESPANDKARTVLTTATLTEETWWTLGTLFGEMEVVAAVHLRPELSHWIHAARDEEDRRAKVLEAVRHIPRPFILYTSRPEDATSWLATLRDIGMKRVDAVRGGDMSTEAGMAILEKWSSRELDAIVATSAFGLGVDQEDVRVVIHACVPETIDRYYQEIGRAGRDGKSALSLLVHTPRDLDIARSLAEERIIGVEKGIARWESMYYASERVPDCTDTILVPLTARRPDVLQDSTANEAWNRRTLLLMARMKLIALDAVAPPQVERVDGETDGHFEARLGNTLKAFFKKSAIKVLKGNHFSKDFWERSRAATKAAGSVDDIRQMEDLLACRTALSEIFRRIYTVRDLGVMPEMAGGGCPVSRRRGDEVSGYVIPIARPIGRIVDLMDRSTLPITPPSGLVIVSYAPPDESSLEKRWYQTMIDVLGRVVTRGILEVAVSGPLGNGREVRELWRKSPLRFVLQRTLDEEDGPFGGQQTPRISIAHWGDGTGRHDHLFGLCRPFHLLIIPTTFPEPSKRGRRIIDLCQHLPLDAFLARLDR